MFSVVCLIPEDIAGAIVRCVKVRRVRAAAQLTQEQVAERAGISQQYISGLERGTRNPSIETVHILAVALGVTHVDLLKPDNEV